VNFNDNERNDNTKGSLANTIPTMYNNWCAGCVVITSKFTLHRAETAVAKKVKFQSRS
jgi:hypothetical protein